MLGFTLGAGEQTKLGLTSHRVESPGDGQVIGVFLVIQKTDCSIV